MEGRPIRWSRWAVVDKAIDDWGKTTRFCLILIVIAGCAVGSLVLAAWLLAAHGSL
jgi:hypothetical protein